MLTETYRNYVWCSCTVVVTSQQPTLELKMTFRSRCNAEISSAKGRPSTLLHVHLSPAMNTSFWCSRNMPPDQTTKTHGIIPLHFQIPPSQFHNAFSSSDSCSASSKAFAQACHWSFSDDKGLMIVSWLFCPHLQSAHMRQAVAAAPTRERSLTAGSYIHTGSTQRSWHQRFHSYTAHMRGKSCTTSSQWTLATR